MPVGLCGDNAAAYNDIAVRVGYAYRGLRVRTGGGGPGASSGNSSGSAPTWRQANRKAYRIASAYPMRPITTLSRAVRAFNISISLARAAKRMLRTIGSRRVGDVDAIAPDYTSTVLGRSPYYPTKINLQHAFHTSHNSR